MSISAIKQALEALEAHADIGIKSDKAITALRKAIAEAEMVEKGTKAWADTPDDWVDDLRGGVEKREWVGLDPETMRNTTLEFNRGALWAERYLKEKNT